MFLYNVSEEKERYIIKLEYIDYFFLFIPKSILCFNYLVKSLLKNLIVIIYYKGASHANVDNVLVHSS